MTDQTFDHEAYRAQLLRDVALVAQGGAPPPPAGAAAPALSLTEAALAARGVSREQREADDRKYRANAIDLLAEDGHDPEDLAVLPTSELLVYAKRKIEGTTSDQEARSRDANLAAATRSSEQQQQLRDESIARYHAERATGSGAPPVPGLDKTIEAFAAFSDPKGGEA